MNKPFDRLRRWLIRRLGGHPDQFQPPAIVRQETRQIQKVEVKTIIPRWDLALANRDPASEASVMRERATLAIADELVRRELILFRKECNGAIPDSMTLRATAFVVTPDADDLPPDLDFVVGGDNNV